MANILDIQTVGDLLVISTDVNPSFGIGTVAPVGSIALASDGSGTFTKTGAGDTAWSQNTSGVVSITKAALQALVTASTLISGTTYSITDAQDALGGTVTVFAVDNNTLDFNGAWTFNANLGAQGHFMLATGAAGSLDQITVTTPSGAVTLLSVAIPYTTSRDNTATLAVANINAGTGTHGFRAWVTTSGATVGALDQPIIHLESTVGQTAFTYTTVVSVTTLTITNLVSPNLGTTTAEITLQSTYDLTNDRITDAFEPTRNNRISCTPARITALTYNPVTKFRWNDARFVGMLLIDSGMTNCEFRALLTTINTNWKFVNTAISGVIFPTTLQRDISIGNGTISNLNLTTGLQLAGSSISTISLTNIDGGALTLTNNVINTFTMTLNTFGSSTSRGTVSILNNRGSSFVMSSNNYPLNTTFSVSTNTIISLTISSNTWLSSAVSMNINNNTFTGTFNFTSNTGLKRVAYTNNIINLLTGNCDIISCAFTTTGTDSIIMTNNTFKETSFNTLTLDYLTIQNSILRCTIPDTLIINGFNVTDSTIDVVVFNLVPAGSAINVISSTIRNTTFTDNADSVSFDHSEVDNCTFRNPSSILSYSEISYLVMDVTEDFSFTDTIIDKNLFDVKYVHDFAVSPLIVGVPVSFTSAIFGLFKEVATVSDIFSTMVGIGASINVGINGGTEYFISTVASFVATPTQQDVTVGTVPILNPTDFLTIAATGADITDGKAVITVKGQILREN